MSKISRVARIRSIHQAKPEDCHDVPAVDGVAPKLAGGAEIIGRDAGDVVARTVGVEVEERTVGPDVGAVVGDVDGDVAHDTNAVGVGVVAEVRPLFEELKLEEALEGDGVVRGGEGGVPAGPRNVAVGFFEGHETGERFEPCGVAGAEGVEGGGGREAMEGAFEDGAFEGDDAGEIDFGIGESGDIGEVGGGEEAGFGEGVGADEEWVAGEGGEALVRRVAIAGGAEREHLPDGLAGGGEEIDEAVRGGTEVADAIRAGEGRDVKEDAGSAGENHSALEGSAESKKGGIASGVGELAVL